MSSAHPTPDEMNALHVRPVAPADKPGVDRLCQIGLLPGWVHYESRNANRIRHVGAADREKFLVAEFAGRIVGTLAIVEAQPDIGHLHWLRVDPEWQTEDRIVARKLARAATDHAREVGLLKLALHAPADAEQRIATYYHSLGFEFSRTREVDGVHVLEFYLNLYERPHPDGPEHPEQPDSLPSH